MAATTQQKNEKYEKKAQIASAQNRYDKAVAELKLAEKALAQIKKENA